MEDLKNRDLAIHFLKVLGFQGLSSVLSSSLMDFLLFYPYETKRQVLYAPATLFSSHAELRFVSLVA